MRFIAHTCVEATVRYAAELGCEVRMVKDATADYSDEEMHAALDINIPNYAGFVVSTEEIADSISAVQRLGVSAPVGPFRSPLREVEYPGTHSARRGWCTKVLTENRQLAVASPLMPT
jgi:Isochorismatase family